MVETVLDPFFASASIAACFFFPLRIIEDREARIADEFTTATAVESDIREIKDPDRAQRHRPHSARKIICGHNLNSIKEQAEEERKMLPVVVVVVLVEVKRCPGQNRRTAVILHWH